MQDSPILVIGKNGKTGGRVTERLNALGYPVRAVSRSASQAFDWTRPATWRPAMEGTAAAYVTYQPDLAVPDALPALRKFVGLATDVGLQHIVLLSGRGEEGAQRAEESIRSSGLAWNIVRASWFCQNFSESFMADGIAAGELVLPAGDTPEPFVDADDIAEVAVAALTDPRYRNKVFEVTGPRAMTFAECAGEISEALSRPVKYRSVSVDAYIGALREQGVPEEMQWLMRELFSVVLDGRNSDVMPGVEEVLGRPATDFKTYVQKAIDAGAWSTGSEIGPGVSS